MREKQLSTLVAADVPKKTGSGYPEPYKTQVEGRARAALGDRFGLNQFGVNMVTLAPGSWSSQRHWHEAEDEFIFVLDGELVLADDAGEHVLKPGMCAGFKADSGNGHCLKNRSDRPATYLEVGTRAKEDRVTYSDIDMMAVKDPASGTWGFVKKDGSGF